ncbi:phosphotransferase-like protein [Burkholderia ubonensis]|uniref:phosphotransferase-like protein n=1 Tax=Burkholderia ubonensis TaxID=101571 RepID=UPI001960FCFD|nr:hypothetical protein [Burkholderia ubonensis]
MLSGFNLLVVGVVAPLEVIEERERNRGDREIGLARWQYQRVHADMKYDLVVDTSVCTPREAALHIKQAFSL